MHNCPVVLPLYSWVMLVPMVALQSAQKATAVVVGDVVVTSHVVSIPEASWLPVLLVPARHGVHTLPTILSFILQVVASHVVTDPEASSLPELVFPAVVFPAGHATQVLFTTF